MAEELTEEEIRANNIAEIRLNIGDRPTAETDRLFSDADLGVFLARENDDTDLATARALRQIAGNAVMVLKLIKRDGLETNGPAMSAELRKVADEFEAMAVSGHEILRTEEDAARHEADERDELWTRYRERDLDRRYGGFNV